MKKLSKFMFVLVTLCILCISCTKENILSSNVKKTQSIQKPKTNELVTTTSSAKRVAETSDILHRENREGTGSNCNLKIYNSKATVDNDLANLYLKWEAPCDVYWSFTVTDPERNEIIASFPEVREAAIEIPHLEVNKEYIIDITGSGSKGNGFVKTRFRGPIIIGTFGDVTMKLGKYCDC